MIELENLGKTFGETRVLSDVSLTMEEGSFTTLLGPSGCGKSTTLRIIAGLDQPSEGVVRIRGKDVTDLSAADRNIAMVFQSYALYPHMTVRENITLPLSMRTMSRVERLPMLDRILPSARAKATLNAGKVRAVAEMLEISDLLERKPAALSGGQMQRVAVGRALVRDPVAFLLDEPLSNLDAKLRTQMRGEIVDLHKRTGRTFVYVTHDQAEAMSMSDRIAVFMHGRIVQEATPRILFEQPDTREVAAFVGDRPINLIELDATDGRLGAPFDAYAVEGPETSDRIVLGIRPETLEMDRNALLKGRMERLEYLGSEAVATVRLDDAIVLRIALNTSDALPEEGAEVGLRVKETATHVFDAVDGRRIGVRLVKRSNEPSRRRAGSATP